MIRNDALMTDLYQLTMGNGYIKCGTADKIAVFDIFYRKKDKLSYAIMAGLEQAVDYLLNTKFCDDDIQYLRSLGIFEEEFLTRLKNFKFHGDVYAVPEGTVIFPSEPILTVVAPIIEAQYVETYLLTIINHQTLIATKASRMAYCTDGGISEFGLRRAQGGDAGIYGARAALIGGCVSTSNVLAGKMFNMPVSGTHSHSWVMSFPDELTAFRAYANTYPTSCLLLVDTYDTVTSGVPNAITVFKELAAKGHRPIGIRIDSGDLAYLSKFARKALDDAGFPDAKIVVSNDIDENILISLKEQGARIDLWGIGTKLITSYDTPALGGVYKLAAIEDDEGNLVPKMKISNAYEKITNPGLKKIMRIYDKATGKAQVDLIMLRDEELDATKPLTVFHPEQTWKRMTLTDYYAEEINTKLIEKGKLLKPLPSIKEICANKKQSFDSFDDEYKRINNPHIYKVDLSERLYELKQRLLLGK